MENKKESVLKSSMTFGAIVGIILVMYSFVLYKFNITNSSLTAISYLILIAGIIGSIYNYKKTYLNGVISYKKALIYGISISFFASIFLGSYTFILFKFDANIISDMITSTEETMLQQNMPEEQIEMTSDMYRNYIYKPITMGTLSVLGFTFIGFILSLIISLFLKNDDNKDEFDKAMEEIEK